MKKITRVLASLAALGALVVLPAASASAGLPQGGAVSVACPSGSGTCTRFGVNYSIPNSTGNFTIYYTVQWSSSLGSYKTVKVQWVNSTSKTVSWGGYGVHYGTYYALGLNGSYSLASGASYSFVESQFNGPGKGLFMPKGQGVYAIASEYEPTEQYHNSSGVTTSGAFLLS